MKLVRNQFRSERGNRRGGGVAKKLFTTIISTCCALEVVYNLWMFINFFLCSFREEEGKVRSRTCRKKSSRLNWIYVSDFSRAKCLFSLFLVRLLPFNPVFHRVSLLVDEDFFYRRRARLSHENPGFGENDNDCSTFRPGDLTSGAIRRFIHRESVSVTLRHKNSKRAHHHDTYFVELP